MGSTQNSVEQNNKSYSRIYPNPAFEKLFESETEQLQLFARMAFYDNPEQFRFVGGKRPHAAEILRVIKAVNAFIESNAFAAVIREAPELEDALRRYLAGDNLALLDGSEVTDTQTGIVSANPATRAARITRLAALYTELVYGKPD